MNGERMNELALFAGAGGGILGGKLLGWRTVCAVEWEPYAAGVLAARQNDQVLEPFPIWDDVQTFDGRPWAGGVDVVSGGFPCQDISTAGKRAGIDGERSGMWKHMARVVSEVRPAFVFVENSPALIFRGLGTVLGDLAALGFDAAWCVLSAADLGAPHLRERIWIVARHPDQGDERAKRRVQERCAGAGRVRADPSGWWATESGVGRVADGVAHRSNRFAAAGNGQVARVAAAAFALLAGRLTPNVKISGARSASDAAPS
ncbi:MAG: DNA cytosine methyltransferase [Burkholderiales bacterium]